MKTFLELPTGLLPRESFAAADKAETQEATSARIKQLLTLKDIAERLQISSVTAWRLHAERGLRVVRIGRSVRVRESDLEEWLKKNST